jgi:ABC-2 type transport system permease protein
MWIAVSSELRRTLLIKKRYPTETLAQIILAVISFYALTLGGKFMAGGVLLGNRLTDLIIGYGLWMLVLNTVGDMGFGIAEEAENGTLEQLFISPLGPLKLFLIRAAVSLGMSLLFIGLVLFGILWLTGIRLTVQPIQLVPAIMALIVSFALGLLVAGLAIVFKRISQALNIFEFGFVFLLMIPFNNSGPLLVFVGHFVPLYPIFSLLRELLHPAGQPIDTASLMAWCLINTLFWLSIGITVFQRAVKLARNRGTIGHY